MIGPVVDHEGHALPDGSAFTQILDQRTLDECARALGRPLWNHEVNILDSLLVALRKQNQKKVKQGKPEQIHSVDELVHIFIDRVRAQDVQAMTDRIIAGGTNG